LYFLCILVFTNDISSPYQEKPLGIKYKKSIPSLFDSDSDLEIDSFQMNDITKSK